MNPRVLHVVAEPEYRLRLTFASGEVKVFDVSPLLDKGVFRELKDELLFRSVRPWHGTVQWSGGQDICPDTLYEESAPAGYASRSEVGKDSASSAQPEPKPRSARAKSRA